MQTIIRDTYIWQLANVEWFEDWKKYFHKKAAYCRDNSREHEAWEAARYDDLAVDREAWYTWFLDAIAGKEVTNNRAAFQVLACFEDLQKIYAINGSFRPDLGSVQKTAQVVTIGAEQTASLIRGEGVHGISDDLSYYYRYRPSRYALLELLTVEDLRLRKLRLDALDCNAFCTSHASARSLTTLTSLHIVMSIRADTLLDSDTGQPTVCGRRS